VNIAHAQLPCHQQPQDPQPRRIRQRFEQVFELGQLIHIFALTNITATIKATYIRVSEYREEVGYVQLWLWRRLLW
jgi:hypothetical protein